jgi:hypothetical protein
MENHMKRYILTENHASGKTNRYNVFDTKEKRVVKGKLSKSDALELEGNLNEKPHKKK